MCFRITKLIHLIFFISETFQLWRSDNYPVHEHSQNQSFSHNSVIEGTVENQYEEVGIRIKIILIRKLKGKFILGIVVFESIFTPNKILSNKSIFL